MLSGISDDLGSINDLRNNELTKLDVDIVALQETRLAEAAHVRVKTILPLLAWQYKR